MTTQLEILFKKRSYEAAMAYSKSNDCQIRYGKKLSEKACVKRGDKLLDMGCGTGELTSSLAEIVGKDGQVVGVDPDFGRIQYAKQKHLSLHSNLVFEHGDSSTDFFQRNKSYYDVHFSNYVFQCLSPERKEDFGRVAFDSLKYAGKIAILSYESHPHVTKQAQEIIFDNPDFFKHDDVDGKIPHFFIKKHEKEALLMKCGFKILSCDYHPVIYKFTSIIDCLNCIATSEYHDGDISSDKIEKLREMCENDDGNVVYVDPTNCQIVAQKI